MSIQTIRKIQSLINKGLSAYHISQALKAEGKRVYCFGSYYTIGRNAADRVCFYETDNGVKCGSVADMQFRNAKSKDADVSGLRSLFNF
jgi:acetyl-CoA carboxylase carboxyltransferase component